MPTSASAGASGISGTSARQPAIAPASSASRATGRSALACTASSRRSAAGTLGWPTSQAPETCGRVLTLKCASIRMPSAPKPPDLQPVQVEAAHVLHHPSARSGDPPVGAHGTQAQQRVLDGAVAQPAGAGAGGGQDAADGGRGVGRIDRQPLVVLGQRPLQIGQARARLHADHQIAGRVRGHLVQPPHRDHPRAVRRRRPVVALAAAALDLQRPALGARLAHQRRQLGLVSRVPAVSRHHQCPSGNLRPLPAPGSTQRPGAGITLPGLLSPRGSNTCAQPPHPLQVGLAVQRPMYASFSRPMPCSPDSAPPIPITSRKMSSPGRAHPLDHPGLALVVQHHRVQVAVAGMEHVADGQLVALADAGDLRQHLGQARAGNDAVVGVVVRAPAAPARRTPACGPSTASAARPRRAPAARRARRRPGSPRSPPPPARPARRAGRPPRSAAPPRRPAGKPAWM